MRLNAILKPRPPMSPRVAMTTLLAAVSLSLVIAAGSGALAMVAGPPAAEESRTTTVVGEEVHGGITIMADQMELKPEGRGAVYEGAVEIRLDKVTGDPAADARLAGVTFLVDGKPAPAGFDPAALPRERVLRVDLITGPIVGDQATYRVNIVLGAGTMTPSARIRSQYRHRSGPPERSRDANQPASAAAVANDIFDITADSVLQLDDGRMLWEGTPRVIFNKPYPAQPGTIQYRILVNGQPAPAGFNPGSLAPDALARVSWHPAEDGRPATLNLTTATGDRATTTP